jgi:peptidoglycan/xylan/chitin deacetylase (PgdA/CDA1 family)
MISRLSKLAIAILFFIGNNVVRGIRSLVGKDTRPTLVIITYHAVKAPQTVHFEKQMNTLLKIGSPISLNDGIHSLKSVCNIAVTFDDAYQSVITNAIPVLQRKNIPATIFIPTGYLGSRPGWIKKNNHPYASETVMTEAQLKTLPDNLITIGSHSVSHINFNEIDKETAEKEIYESKLYLENILNKNIILFAAPFATLNESILPVFKKAGYERVFLNIPTYPATKTDLYLLGRTSIEPTDWPIEYILKFKGAYQWLPWAIRFKRVLMLKNH